MTALSELQTRIADFDDACARLYGAATFAFSAEGASLEMLRPAFDRAHAARLAMEKAKTAMEQPSSDDIEAALAARTLESMP